MANCSKLPEATEINQRIHQGTGLLQRPQVVEEERVALRHRREDPARAHRSWPHRWTGINGMNSGYMWVQYIVRLYVPYHIIYIYTCVLLCTHVYIYIHT